MNTVENFLEERLASFAHIFSPERVFLGILSLIGCATIILFNEGALPLSLPYGIFYITLLFLFALYRPQLVWQLVVFFLAFEVPKFLLVAGSIDIRIYQAALVALMTATLVLCVQKKILPPAPRWFDGALALVIVGALITFWLRGLPLENSKDIIILLSFAALYLLGRFYLRKKKDIRTLFVTLITSALVVTLYALYQMVAFQKNWQTYMVMSGRPNSSFEEADWLGFFMGTVALITIVAALHMKRWYQEIVLGAALLFFLIVLIVTVSRSAWLGFGAGVGILGIILAYEYFSGFIHARARDTRAIIKFFVGGPIIFLLALISIYCFSLTRFELSDRLVSTGTGEQVITVACAKESVPPVFVSDIQELPRYGCQHINLEEQEFYQAQGYVLAEVERPDPNINIRKNIYQETKSILKDHFFLGIGWGESVKVFGTDDRGAGLNSSNLFLEVWLGSGLIGIFGFLLFWLGILVAIGNRLVHKREMTEGYWLSIIMLLIWVQATIFNLFNAGLLSGAFLIVLMLFAWYGEKTVPYSIKSIWQK